MCSPYRAWRLKWLKALCADWQAEQVFLLKMTGNADVTHTQVVQGCQRCRFLSLPQALGEESVGEFIASAMS